MRELMRTNDPMLATTVEMWLKAAGIPMTTLDQNISGLEGSIGIIPRRLLVADEDFVGARDVLHEAGLGHHLAADPA